MSIRKHTRSTKRSFQLFLQALRKQQRIVIAFLVSLFFTTTSSRPFSIPNKSPKRLLKATISLTLTVSGVDPLRGSNTASGDARYELLYDSCLQNCMNAHSTYIHIKHQHSVVKEIETSREWESLVWSRSYYGRNGRETQEWKHTGTTRNARSISGE